MKKKTRIKLFLGLAWVALVVTAVIIFISGFKNLSFDDFTNPITNLFQENRYEGAKKVISRELVEEESATIKVVEEVSPAVVSIIVKTIDFDLFSGPMLNESGIGTGFIVDSNGLIITNNHVVNDPRGEYSVVLKDGTTYEVERIHLDSISDLAILEITARDLPTVELGDSDNLQVGQKAIAIGNALGRFQNTVTMGVVSGIGREVIASGGIGTRPTLQADAIQTDAALNPGNSGGPLLNIAGQVIGINVATTIGADNISFAIPVNTLKPLLEIFAEEGKIVRPYIGISYTLITPEIASLRDMPVGAYINRVLPNTSAEAEDLQRGDIITEIDGDPVDEQNSIAKVIASKKVGDVITLTIDRSGDVFEIDLELGEAPQSFR